MNTRNEEVHFLSDPAPYREKERLYLEVRRREGRILSDEEVRRLPFVPESHPLATEWRWRRRSFARFFSYCQQWAVQSGKTPPLRLLDLGCGNGWLANRLAENPDWDVWALDVNEEELEQGARLFGRDNLRFGYADLVPRNGIPGSWPGISFRDTGRWPGIPFRGTGTFDLIVLAASVQYFPDLRELVAALRARLNPGGEIHLIDSPFYASETERDAARRRTADYYAKTGVPAMAAYYHHHLWTDVLELGGQNLNKSLKIRFLQKIKWLAPFPWVRLQSR